MNRLFFILFSLLVAVHGYAQHITVATKSDTVCAGTSVNFHASDSGVISPHFQWLLNGTQLTGDSATHHFDSLNNQDKVWCLLEDSLSNVLAISDTIQLVVQHFPNAGVITGPDTVCVGSYITLTDTVAGGVWSVSNTDITVDSGNVFAFGIYGQDNFDTCTVFYTVDNVCGSNSSKFALNILDIADPTWEIDLIPDVVCVGTTFIQDCSTYFYVNIYSKYAMLQIYCDYSVDSSDLWIDALKIGTDYIYASDSNYCGSYNVGKYVTIVPGPSVGTINLPVNGICVGDTLQLTDSNYNGSLYWYVSCEFVSPLNCCGSGLVVANSPGKELIRLSVSMSCGEVEAIDSVIVHPQPKINLTYDTVCAGSSMQLTTNASGGTWSSLTPAYLQIEDQRGTGRGIATGTAVVRYTAPTGCAADTTIQVENCPSLVQIYPNPTTESIEVHLFSDAFNNFMVMNDVGQSLITGIIADRYSFINTESLSPGIYFLRVAGPGQSQVVRFVKE